MIKNKIKSASLFDNIKQMNYECLMDVWSGWLVASFYIISFIYFSIKRKDADLVSLIIPVLVLGNFFLLIFIIYSQIQC